jgi:hypothetical protein
MRLSGRILRNVASVNMWQTTNQAFVQEGQENIVYIQLLDADFSTANAERSPAFNEFPIRYLSQASVVSVFAKFDAIDDEDAFEVTGTKPFADDKSIWKFVLADDQTPRSGNLIIRIVEDGVQRSFLIKNAISVETLNVGSC